jgi:nitrogen fixation/metabolism regulation signal transduction histidine kinase
MVVFLGLFLFLLMAAVSVLGAVMDRDLLTQQLRDEGVALARAYALSAENALILNGAGLARVVGEAGQIPEITFLMIVDPTGRVVAHSDPTHFGEMVGDPAVKRALETPIGAVEAGRTPTVALKSPWGSQEVLEVIVPLVVLDQIRGVLDIGLGTDLIRQAAVNTTRSSFLIALAAFLLGVAFIVGFSRSLTRPLEGLAKAADQIRAGTWDMPIQSRAGGEVGKLAAAMERMRQEVSASFVRLAERTTEVDQLRAYAENILDSLQAGVISLDLDGTLGGMNLNAVRMLGLATAPAPGSLPLEVLAPWPDLAAGFQAVLSEGLSREVVLGSPVSGTKAPNRLVRLHATRLRDRAGVIIGELVVLDDITFLRSMETRMRDAEKMAAMGELSAGVAHEVRNPLNSIRNAAQFLGGKFEPNDARNRFTDLIIEEVDRLNALVSRLLQYTRSEKQGHEVHDLRQSVDQAMVLAALKVPSSRVPLVRRFAEDLPLVWADPRRIVQLMLNLLFNAYEAIPDRGTITVSVEPVDGRVRVSVDDTGVGMTAETLERLGEPFFTTRESGTGLGLAIARQIADEHQAVLTFQSAQGRGTIVALEFRFCHEEISHEESHHEILD